MLRKFPQFFSRSPAKRIRLLCTFAEPKFQKNNAMTDLETHPNRKTFLKRFGLQRFIGLAIGLWTVNPKAERLKRERDE